MRRGETSPNPISVSVSRLREGGVVVAVRYSFEGRPPSLRKRTEMAKAVLGDALDRLEKGKPVDRGFSEDARRLVRTDKIEA